MTTPVSLREFVSRLQQAETIPRPESEAWTGTIARISIEAMIAEIDEETYFHFLEVLPPKFQSGTHFAFAEGAEAIRLFWQKNDHYFCRQLTWDETKEFCRLARVPLPW